MTATSDPTRYERGLAKLAEVDGQTGQQIVSRLGDLGRYIVEFAFGDIYSRPGLSLREREIATVAALTVLGGREPQLRVHIEAALHVGITMQELEEIVLQTVPYAGFPTAINAMNLLSQFKNAEETDITDFSEEALRPAQ
jgi:4-carboxymuconolactone decarboxylase